MGKGKEMGGTLSAGMEPVASKAMDAKLREIWGKFEKGWMRRELRSVLPPTRIEWMGVKFIVYPRDNFTEFRMWELGRPPEHEATEEIAAMLAGSNAVIVDVGANAGAFGLPILARAGKTARGLFFEPNPVMLQRLNANIGLNEIKNARVFDCAISDAPGRSAMFFPKNGNLGQGRVELSYAGTAEADETIEVEIKTLPDCLRSARVARVDFLKVDVEGLEDKVIVPLLDGDEKLWPGMIYFEVEHQGSWDLPLLGRLAECGYDEVKSFGKNRLYRRAK
ncbi:FkbM family methyltransferase [Marimonas arenosa]|uniref:FkbM family methyltransferase n=1 Tax=Marimonas arenosa TaxID=1795305 RepID=A0AAE3WEZ3_9RHOB|nr:FkbM family methyltransferase [Marimonas arenosa]MDQ2091283.1 FkbM family methyltransferase [Marimonas arenosa]